MLKTDGVSAVNRVLWSMGVVGGVVESTLLPSRLWLGALLLGWALILCTPWRAAKRSLQQRVWPAVHPFLQQTSCRRHHPPLPDGGGG